MKYKGTLILGLLVGAVLLGYMLTYQVRFNEVAVLTTFGKAGPEAVKNADGQGAGLYLKCPWPIQEVRLYDRRVQILDTQLEQVSTKDSKTVVASVFVAWQIGQALDFSNRFRAQEEARPILENRVRAATNLNEYAFDDLVSGDRLAEAGDRIRQRMEDELSQGGSAAYGVRILAVRIKRLEMPEKVTKQVFSQMTTTRERLAQAARSEGKAEADRIRNEANSDRDRILSYAERRAKAIRTEGEAAAMRELPKFQADEELAVFLKKLETIEKTLQHNTTIILDTETAPYDLFKEAPKKGSAPGP